MARRSKKKSPVDGLGAHIRTILEDTPAATSRMLLESAKGSKGPLLNLSGTEALISDERDSLITFVADQDPEIRAQLEILCREVVELGEGKGATSLLTAAGRKLLNVEFDAFDRQPDCLCKSAWTRVNHPSVFEDAQSFYAARQYRDHGKLYSAFEVDIDDAADARAEDLDLDAFRAKVAEVLELKGGTTATALDLPETEAHPPSVMVALRHGGRLSSVKDHRDDGHRETLYYRPGNEAVFIYTPALRQLEVCAGSYAERLEASKTFASVLLGQDISKKPLTRRNYDLGRFRRSLDLPLPEFDDVEINFATVTELQMRLGDWSRVLTLKVSKNDQIEQWADQYLRQIRDAASRHGYSRIMIAVGYHFLDGQSGTLNISITSSNNSNIQSWRDPRLRDLGHRLLTFWRILERFRDFDAGERARHFDDLVTLYDWFEDEVTGAFLADARMDRERLVSAAMIEKKGRQDIILVEDIDLRTTEVDITPGERAGTIRQTGPFGEDLGTAPAGDSVIYRIQREWLTETICNVLQRELGVSWANIVDDHVVEFRPVEIGGNSIPTYLVRSLRQEGVVQKLDVWFRRRQEAGFGLILTTSDVDPQYLGPNVVVPLRSVVSLVDDGIVLDPEALERAFISGRFLAAGGDRPQLVRHRAGDGTLFLPGSPPLRLSAGTHVLIFSRLVDAALTGEWDVKTSELMRGMGSGSPQHLFRKAKWESIRNKYICSIKSRHWRLCEAKPAPV